MFMIWRLLETFHRVILRLFSRAPFTDERSDVWWLLKAIATESVTILFFLQLLFTAHPVSKQLFGNYVSNYIREEAETDFKSRSRWAIASRFFLPIADPRKIYFVFNQSNR